MKTTAEVLAFLASSIFLWVGNTQAQSLVVQNSNINIIQLDALADDANEPGIDFVACNLPLPAYIPGLLGSQLGFICQVGARQVVTPEYNTNANNNVFSTINGSGTSTMTVFWNSYAQSHHFSPIMPPGYQAFTNTNVQFELEIDATMVPVNTPVVVQFSYQAYSAAGEVEVGGGDLAVTIPTIELGGVDLFQDAGFNMSFSSNTILGWNNVTKSGTMVMLAGTPVTLSITHISNTNVVDPGAGVYLGYFKDRATANFIGTITLSADPLFIPPVVNPPLPTHPFFSVDIGSSNELSSPTANGSEYFDPGDAYRFQVPTFPFGGGDGNIDDASFMGFDIPPSTPDLLVPHLTAVPLGTGLPLNAYFSSFLNIDGLSITNQTINSILPAPLPATTSPCLKGVEHLFLSYDDDRAENYTMPGPSVPGNSYSPLTLQLYGTSQRKDEIVQLDVNPLTLTIGAEWPLLSEGQIHPNLLPNPVDHPLEPLANTEDDDVNAVTFTNNLNLCPNVYFSVDHQGRGTDPAGNVLDPGIIYRVDFANQTAIPAVLHPDIGILPGTDIDAFEFVMLPNPLTFALSGFLGMLFSVDVDDPGTAEDESGGLLPNQIYYSYITGNHALLDSSFIFTENIDGIAAWDASPQTAISSACHPNNFTTPPVNLTASASGNTFNATWTPYGGSRRCELNRNRNDLSGNYSFYAGDLTGTITPSSAMLTIPQLQPNKTYRVRIRCSCATSGTLVNSPWSAFVLFTTPPGPAVPSAGDGSWGGGSAVFSEPNLVLAPNPASDRVQVSMDGFPDGSVRIALINVLGAIVIEYNLTAVEGRYSDYVDVSQLPAGVYFFTAMTGDIKLVKKLVVE